MPFYKAVLRAGHAGRGHYRDLTVYVYTRDNSEVFNTITKFPMVKHDNVKAIQNLSQIDEVDYIIGILQNSYYSMSSQEDGRIRSLGGVIKILKRLCKDCVLKTDEAKNLKEFCNRYRRAEDKQKIQIEKEYLEWADKLIKEYENEKHNFPKL